MSEFNTENSGKSWYEQDLARDDKFRETNVYPFVRIVAIVLGIAILFMTVFIVLVHPIDRFKLRYLLTRNCTITIESAWDKDSKVVVEIQNEKICISSLKKNHYINDGKHETYTVKDKKYYMIKDGELYEYKMGWNSGYWDLSESDDTTSEDIEKILNSWNYVGHRFKDNVELVDFSNVEIEFGFNLILACKFRGSNLTFTFHNIGTTRVVMPY